MITFSTKLEGYAKTVNLIDGRIKQMSTYLPTRERIAKQDEDLVEFLSISGYRYETLRDTLEYVKDLWDMTKDYVSSTQKLYANVSDQITSASLNKLTVVTVVSACATTFNLLTKGNVAFSTAGVISVLVILAVGLLANRLIKYLAEKRKYEISDVDYEKNIK